MYKQNHNSFYHSDTAGLAVTIPGLVGRDLSTRYDWNLTTTPQSFLDNETRPYNAGRVVGGSSLLNGMVWTRGSMADYDAWEALGNPGWGWKGLLPYFKKASSSLVRVTPTCQLTRTPLNRARPSLLRLNPGLVAHSISTRTCQHMARKVQSRSPTHDSSMSNQVQYPIRNVFCMVILTLDRQLSAGTCRTWHSHLAGPQYRYWNGCNDRSLEHPAQEPIKV